MHIGFTGTRKGMTVRQAHWFVRTLIKVTNGEPFSFHHGDCIGADDEAHFLICSDIQFVNIPVNIIIHPGYSASRPDDVSMRANNMADEIREPKQHFARNRDIVNESELLIAVPICKPIPASGGTAYTIDYARKTKKEIVIIYPDGELGE